MILFTVVFILITSLVALLRSQVHCIVSNVLDVYLIVEGYKVINMPAALIALFVSVASANVKNAI